MNTIESGKIKGKIQKKIRKTVRFSKSELQLIEFTKDKKLLKSTNKTVIFILENSLSKKMTYTYSIYNKLPALIGLNNYQISKIISNLSQIVTLFSLGKLPNAQPVIEDSFSVINTATNTLDTNNNYLNLINSHRDSLQFYPVNHSYFKNNSLTHLHLDPNDFSSVFSFQKEQNISDFSKALRFIINSYFDVRKTKKMGDLAGGFYNLQDHTQSLRTIGYNLIHSIKLLHQNKKQPTNTFALIFSDLNSLLSDISKNITILYNCFDIVPNQI